MDFYIINNYYEQYLRNWEIRKSKFIRMHVSAHSEFECLNLDALQKKWAPTLVQHFDRKK